MVSEGRILNYKFNNTGSLTTSAANASFETDYALNGKLLAVKTDILNSVSTGSMFITHNGDVLFSKLTFTKAIQYPRKLICDAALGTNFTTAVSGNVWVEQALTDKVTVVASGVGPGSSFYCELIYQRA